MLLLLKCTRGLESASLLEIFNASQLRKTKALQYWGDTRVAQVLILVLLICLEMRAALV